MSKHRRIYLEGIKKLSLREVDTPDTVNGNEVLVKVKAAGICGSDISCYNGHSKEGRYDIAPYVPGHEWAGEVVAIGEKVKTIKVGNKVTGDCCIPCNTCANCKDGKNAAYCYNLKEVGFMPNAPGGMGEYLTGEESCLHVLPEELSYEEGALVEPFSIAYYAMWGYGSWVDASDVIAVTGAGPIGIAALAVGKTANAKVIVIDPIKFRRDRAKELKADLVIDSMKENVVDTVKQYTNGHGADMIIECSGTDAGIASTVEMAAHEGRIRLIGHSIGRKVPIEIGWSIWKGLDLHGHSGSPNFFPRTIKFMAQSKNVVDYIKIITHKFPIEEYKKAFELGDKGKAGNDVMKIMFIMNRLGGS